MLRDSSVFVHERGLCESEEVGAGTRIWAFAQVMRGARVGSDCNICGHSFIEGGAVLGDRVTVKNGVQVWDKVTVEDEVFLGPNATFTNDFSPRAAFRKSPDEFLPTLVKRGSSIGANATVICGVVIGDQALIGAGSVVTRDVPAHALMLGNPARRTGWVCACGAKLGHDLACHCGRRYRLVNEETGLAPIE